MKDKEFLLWIHNRLVEVHGENPYFDYMHKLRAIINNTDHEKFTPNFISTDTNPIGYPKS